MKRILSGMLTAFTGFIIFILVALLGRLVFAQVPGQPQLHRRTEPQLAPESCAHHLLRDQRELMAAVEEEALIAPDTDMAKQLWEFRNEVRVDSSFTESPDNCTKQHLLNMDVVVAVMQFQLAQDKLAKAQRDLKQEDKPK